MGNAAVLPLPVTPNVSLPANTGVAWWLGLKVNQWCQIVVNFNEAQNHERLLPNDGSGKLLS